MSSRRSAREVILARRFAILLMLAACRGGAPSPRGSADPEASVPASSARAPSDTGGAPAPRGSADSATSAASHSLIAQLVLDLPELQQYYHVDTLPDRVPVRIATGGAVADQPPLEKFGKPVRYVAAGEAHVVFDAIDQHGDRAEVRFRYTPEGVAGRVLLEQKDGVWRVARAELSEH